MTIVEVVVAAVLLVMAATATLGIVDTSTRTTFRAEETQTVINVAQREIEYLRDLSYDELAMEIPVPPATMDANLPTSRIRPNDQFCLERVDGDDECTAAPLVRNGGELEHGGGTIDGGAVEPLTEDVQVGDITMDIYRFVVWQNEGGAPLLQSHSLCQRKPLHFRCKTQDYKRVVVAVKTQEAAISHDRPYEEVQSDFIDPDRATLDARPLGPGGDVVTGQQFWLSDTRCQDGSAEPSRSPGSNHPTHDTLGSCSVTERAPDALLNAPPGGDAALFDFSTEIEPPCPDPAPDPLPPDWPNDCSPADHGLQMLDQETTCVPNLSGGNAPRQLHRWVSMQMPTTFEMTDRATLELWTRTINGVEGASGKVCAFLFKRSVAGGVETDIQLRSASMFDPDWPSGPPWEEVRLTFDLDSLSPAQRTLQAGERLGVAIAVDPEGTPNNVLQFLYDHPDGESRLEVLTTTPLSSSP